MVYLGAETFSGAALDRGFDCDRRKSKCRKKGGDRSRSGNGRHDPDHPLCVMEEEECAHE